MNGVISLSEILTKFVNFHVIRMLSSNSKEEALFHFRSIRYYTSLLIEETEIDAEDIVDLYNNNKLPLPIRDFVDKYQLMGDVFDGVGARNE
jgi:hypothetical protein